MRVNSGRTLDLNDDLPENQGMRINRRFRERTPGARDRQQRCSSQPNTSGYPSFEEDKFNEVLGSKSLSEVSVNEFNYASGMTEGNISPQNYHRQPRISFCEEMKMSTPPRRFISDQFKREIANKKKNSVAENTEENVVLSCTICFSNEPETFMICRFCGNNACNLCWDRLFNQRSKCFFCRKRMYRRDLIRNTMIDQIRQKESNIKNRDKQKLIKKCPDHESEGKLFCVKCSCFICTDCITESLHAGHKVCDIEDRPDLKRKAVEANEFCNELKKGLKLLENSIKNHSKLVDMNNRDLIYFFSGIKNSILNTLEEIENSLTEKLKLETSLNSEAKNECKIFRIIIKDVTKLNLETIDPKKLKNLLKKNLKNSDASILQSLTKGPKIDFTTHLIEDKFMLTSDSTGQTRFSAYMKKILRDSICKIV
ncbi:unnamed protein product [Moneuplotes crassus]|uniref:B box-type domain-containing protein n=1 Tax=Euplotes crassus TaxID=5936 RepID=A0AAD1XET1_EUPCR|nr:unnamed protein product [Moneuplotes crassus]